MQKSYFSSDFHCMAKPAGPKCNLNCSYCFYKEKKHFYPHSTFSMSNTVMKQYIKQVLNSRSRKATISWQGGEPLLMGLDFFKSTIEHEKSQNKAGISIQNTIQTNGTLIDEAWSQFFHDNGFLVGISLDGPRNCHNAFRKDKKNNSVFDRIVKSVKLLQRFNVEFNILCTVNSFNSQFPLDVYHFFRDELKVSYLQFIPIVEIDKIHSSLNNIRVTNESVSGRQYGNFLISIFDEWAKTDIGQVFIQLFDAVLASYVYGVSSVCTFQPCCGTNLVLEHNGDLYSCDHFVEEEYYLGNLKESSLVNLARAPKQIEFGLKKSKDLQAHCLNCEFLFTCYGECPKNRIAVTPDGHKINWLCDGLKLFFSHTKEKMQQMANFIKQGKSADKIMA